MNDSRQFFSHGSRPNYVNPLAIRVGDMIRYQIGETIWIGVVIETNKYNYLHMAEIEWLNDGQRGTVDLRDCSCVARA